jgi:1-acyl-sn-glycerol-3-phosphate acyltransferase
LLQRVALYAFHLLFVRPVLRWVAGVRFRRLSNVPSGPCLVVANHNSHLDAAVLMSIFPLKRLSRVHPVAAADYFGSNWFMRTLAMLCMNGIPIQRRPVRGEDPLLPIAALLKRGESLIFFPEGSRGEAGVVTKFRAGVGRLVKEVPGLLVLPVYLSGPERIWPRGELVPVPLNVDAIIGKPRSYPALDDPRDIADLVRRDVLALAPSPPPVPGERPQPPLRVAICGIDRAANEKLFRAATERLGRAGATLGIGSPMLEADPAGLRETIAPAPVGQPQAWLGALARIFRTGPRFPGRSFTGLVERSQINEALGGGQATRFVVEQGSVLVDLIAAAATDLDPEPTEHELRDLLRYAAGDRKTPIGRAWRLIRGAPALWLINVFHLTRATPPEVVVHLTASPARVMEELRSSGTALGPHQSEPQLERLRQAYGRVTDLLRRRRKVRLLEIPADGLDPEEAARTIEEACHGLAAAGNAASDG